MEINHKSRNSLAETPETMATVNNSNGEPVAEEIVIHDECGDALWDSVLAQKSFLELKTNENIGATKM